MKLNELINSASDKMSSVQLQALVTPPKGKSSQYQSTNNKWIGGGVYSKDGLEGVAKKIFPL
jgi:hypothetical protein